MGPKAGVIARSEPGYVSASEITSHWSMKSLSASGCGPLTVTSDEMNSPVSSSKVSANVMRTGVLGVPVRVEEEVPLPFSARKTKSAADFQKPKGFLGGETFHSHPEAD